MSGKHILILGGGIGGLVTANELRSLLPPIHRITLIEKSPRHAFAPSFLWVMTGARDPAAITRPMGALVRGGIAVVQAEVTGIDTEHRRIATSDRGFEYDYLVIALGAELAPELIRGLAEGSHSFYTLEDTSRLRQALLHFSEGSIALVVSSLPYKCPGAPHEAAMLVAGHFKERGLKESVRVDLYTPESQPMPVAGPELGEAIKGMLHSKGIGFHPLHRLSAVDAQNKTLAFEGQGPVHYDLLIAIPPHRAPRIVRESGMGNDMGWIPVDRSTLRTKHDGVFAIGDIAAVAIPGRWKSDVPMMLPKAGVFAHAQAEVVAQRIAAEIQQREPTAEFCGTGYCMLEAGEGLAGFASGNFFAEPSPRLELRHVGRAWHLGKVMFEQWWLSPFGFKKKCLRALLRCGARALRIPVEV